MSFGITTDAIEMESMFSNSLYMGNVEALTIFLFEIVFLIAEVQS